MARKQPTPRSSVRDYRGGQGDGREAERLATGTPEAKECICDGGRIRVGDSWAEWEWQPCPLCQEET